MLLADLEEQENLILASVKGDFGREIASRFTRAVWVDVPKDVRLARVRARSLEKFGGRMLPGGDLYEQEARFLQMIERRGEGEVADWLRRAGIPTLKVDGRRPVEENAARILRQLR
jgi:hypothetical protein